MWPCRTNGGDHKQLNARLPYRVFRRSCHYESPIGKVSILAISQDTNTVTVQNTTMKCKTLAEQYGVTAMQHRTATQAVRTRRVGGLIGRISRSSFEPTSRNFNQTRQLREMEEAIKPQFVDSVCSYTQEGRHEVECKLREDGDIITVRALIPFSKQRISLQRATNALGSH